MGSTDEDDNTHEHGENDWLIEYDRYPDLMRNDSEFMNSIGGGFVYVSGIFNQTGESTAYIYGSNGQSYRVSIDTPNGTVESVEKVDRFPEWVYQAYESINVTSGAPPDIEEVISKLTERTGYSREELFGSENPFNTTS